MDKKYTEKNTLDSKFNRALKPDAQAFDEIRLVTKPRFKTSSLSGNEWRISVHYQFYRKGKLIEEDFCGHDMEKATNFLAWKFATSCDNGNAYYAGERDICDQEGCSKVATVVYQLKNRYCKDGHATVPTQTDIRLFCDEHKRRGNSSFEDSDSNYMELK